MAGTWPWLKRWLTTTYHKDIGILYLVSSLYFGFVGAVLALLMRIQLSGPNNNFLDPTAYNQAVTMHGLIMILWFLSPLGIALANYFVPTQIGAKDLALPRINALGYWLYLFGGLLATIGFFMPGGAANGGWTTYAPLSSATFSPGPGPTLAFAGLIMLIVSITIGSVNFLITVAWMRAPGITWSKVPMFTWFFIFTILAMLFAFPSLLAAMVMLMSDRILGTFYFTASAGGAILWDQLFWFFGHPEVYVVLLPAFGAVAEILPVFSKRPLAEKNLILFSTGAVIIPLSYLVWTHHMFLTGISLTERESFSVSTLLISIPFDLITLSFITTLYKGKIHFTTPMLFAIGSVLLFIIGGITGVFLSSFVLDTVLHGTYFIVAHFHYVMVGAAIFGLMGAVYYWLPNMTGKLFSEKFGKLHFIFSFIGFNLLYFPMFALVDMPRRIFTYSDVSFAPLNMIATVGAFVFAFAQFFFIGNIIWAIRSGPPSTSNPWGASTLEWLGHGIIGGSTPQGADAHSGGYGAGASASPASEHAGEHTSMRPLELSLGMAVTFFGLALFNGYSAGLPVVLIGCLIAGWSLWGWAKDDLGEKFSVGLDEVVAERWPFQQLKKLQLGMWIFLSTEVIVFGAIIGSFLFIRINSTVWPAPGSVHDIAVGLLNTIVLLTSSLTVVLAVGAARLGKQRLTVIWLTATLLLGTVFMAVKATEWYGYFTGNYGPHPLNSIFTFSSGLPGSTYFFTTGIHGAHVVAGLLITVYLIKKATNGGYSKENHLGIENFGLYWHFVDVLWVFLFPLFYLI